MNTALTVTPVVQGGPATVAPHVRRFHERIARRMGAALVAWSRRADRGRTREELAELHQRRLEASRLRDETRTVAMMSHVF